jgi:hypothetical protein
LSADIVSALDVVISLALGDWIFDRVLMDPRSDPKSRFERTLNPTVFQASKLTCKMGGTIPPWLDDSTP